MRRWLFASLAAFAVIGTVLFVQGAVPCEAVSSHPDCYVALRPGPVEDTFMLVEVDGTPSYASSGELLLTTIAVDDDLGFVDWVRASTSRTVDAVPRDRIYPPGIDRGDLAEQNAALMADSQLTATLVALAELGYDLEGEGARVAGVADDVVTRALEVGDVIVAVDGAAVSDNAGVVDLVHDRSPGDRLALDVVRDGSLRTVDVMLGTSPDEPGRAYIGVFLTTEIELPVDVRIDAGVIGGPSAGLMFALAIVDLLQPEDLTGGAVVGGTGTVGRDGAVGAVGGVRQKLIASVARSDGQRPASVFLVPRGNLEEASQASVSREVLLVPVDSLEGALDALGDLKAGRRPVDALALPASGGQ